MRQWLRINPTHDPQPSFWTLATQRDVMRRAARISLIVGTLIALINHGDKILMGRMDAASWIKCLLTYLVPYGVSTYSSVMAIRDRRRTDIA